MARGQYNPWMRDEQIVASWRDAKNRNAQVEILSELNAVPRRVIEDILIAHGCEVERKKKPPEREKEKKHWKAADDERLMVLHGEGKSYAEIAVEMERTAAAVRQRIFNLKRKEKEMNGREWTSDEVAFMLERWKQGMDARHIAAEMGRSVPAIAAKLKKLRAEGKKIAAEIEAEEKVETKQKRGVEDVAPYGKQTMSENTLADRIMRIVQDYKKAAETVGGAREIKITADEKHVTLVGTGGEVVFHMQETVITK